MAEENTVDSDQKRIDCRRDAFLIEKSYELRTPLNAVIGMTQLLLDTDLSPQQLEYAKIIQNSGQQLLEVVAGFCDTSRNETVRQVVDSTEFSLRDTLEGLAELLAPPAQKKGLEVTALVRSDLADRFVGDCERLKQILINLVNSAIKVTGKGEVVIGARPGSMDEDDGDHCVVQFSVRHAGQRVTGDAGFSLSDTVVLPKTPLDREEASGEGLTLCEHLVDQLGGTISVDSSAGRGTAVRFSLPLRAVQGASEPTSDARDALQHLKVLCVDDSSSCLAMIEGFLRAWEIDVRTARSGQHAMEQLLVPAGKDDSIDLVIADKLMPEMDGVELTRSIRNIPELATLPVILMTPLAFSGREAVLKPLGISGFLTKPIRREPLLEAIVEVLGIDIDRPPQSAAETLQSTAADDTQIVHRKERILLVEDNLVNRKMALAFLKRLGFRPEVAVDGRDALGKIESAGPFDLVLMDCQMPEMDGFQATRLIREHERTTGEHLPIIALTAHAMAEDRERCLAAGMDSYLSKPVVIEKLAAELDRFLLRRQVSQPEEPAPAS